MTSRGLLQLTGPQRIWFLQQTITADVEDLPDGRWRESAFLTPKGKIVSHFAVGILGEEVYLDIDPPADALVDWLTRYRFRTKVEIEDLSGPSRDVIGDAAAALAGEGAIVRAGDAIAFGYRYGDVPVAHVHGTTDAPQAPAEELERIRIEAGVPRFGVDYTTDNLPQEAGLTRVVPIDKGCYVGQETVARIHFRGHVNKVCRPVVLEAGGAVGDDLLLEGNRIGSLTSVAGRAAIAMARTEPEAGTRVEIASGGSGVLGAVPEGTKVKTA